MVTLFEVSSEGARRIGPAASLAEASRSLPDGSYTTLLVREGHRVLDFAAHVSRLGGSAPAVGSIDPRGLALQLLEMLRTEQLSTARLRLTWCRPRLFVSVEPHAGLSAELYQSGVACRSVALHRTSPGLKDTRFIAAAAAAREAFDAGVHEGLLVGPGGALLEGLSSNFFAVRDRELWTAGAGVLLGLTRRRVLALATGVVSVRLEPIRLDELKRVAEAFLTSASRGVLPVVEIDGRAIGSGTPGAVAKKLGSLLTAAEDAEAIALEDLAQGAHSAG